MDKFLKEVNNLQGIILKNGEKVTVEEKNANELFSEGQCAVFVDNTKKEIFLWKGKKSHARDRFSAAHLAENLDKREFGGAGRIIQDAKRIKKTIASSEIEDIPQGILRSSGI